MGLTYEFKDVETRPPPTRRTDTNVRVMIGRARPNRPFLGHKGDHFLAQWEGVDWSGNFCDKIHDLKLLCEMSVKDLVGTHSSQGMYKSWATKRKDVSHRQDCRAYNIFADFHSNADSPPPWRLSKEEVDLCDRRVQSTWWPHNMDAPCFGGHSFWTHSDRMWKVKHKRYVFLTVIPTCLHGCSVLEVHTALLVLISVLRRLGGEVICIAEARRRHFVPGFHV